MNGQNKNKSDFTGRTLKILAALRILVDKESGFASYDGLFAAMPVKILESDDCRPPVKNWDSMPRCEISEVRGVFESRGEGGADTTLPALVGLSE
jgi:hypothetical protein